MNHQYDGQGGSYVIDEGGERKLVERTREVGDIPPAPSETTEQSTPTEPADAGIFTPAALADQTTTTE